MISKGHKICPLTDKIVAYIYGEIDGGECSSFESHLADCVTCTDDFAAISNARFSVFEWRKEEFDQLATPSFVIPELAKSTTAANTESGWFAGLAALLSFARSPLAVAATLLLFMGVGLIAFTYFIRSEELIATNTEVKLPSTNEDAVKKQVIDSLTEVIPPDVVVPIRKQAPSYKPIRTAEIKRAVNNTPRRLSSPQTARKPVLNDFNDETDESLRLADLFDEVGG